MPLDDSRVVEGHAVLVRIRDEHDLDALPWLAPQSMCVVLVLAGQCVVQSLNSVVNIEAEGFVLLDAEHKPRLRPSSESHVVAMVFSELSVPVGKELLRAVCGVPLATNDSVREVFVSLARSISADDSPRNGQVNLYLADALIALLAASLLESPEAQMQSPDRHASLLVAVRRTIESRLHDPELRIAQVASAHHISVSTLQKLFAAQGDSVTGWIRERRLERCRRDLANPEFSGLSVSSIANRWGFLNAAHFSRTFSKNFGMTPREYRAVSKRPADRFSQNGVLS